MISIRPCWKLWWKGKVVLDLMEDVVNMGYADKP